MLNPTPLFFQVPRDELMMALREASGQIGPDSLCFEEVYQAVAMSWPRDFEVVDVGGFQGAQGWLFRDFERYVDVDSYDLFPEHDGLGVPRRCGLPGNGMHLVAEGKEYLRAFLDFGDGCERTLFVCAGVPDRDLREMVASMPNSVVWYPGEGFSGQGMLYETTTEAFGALEASGWRKRADKAVWEAVCEGLEGSYPEGEAR